MPHTAFDICKKGTSVLAIILLIMLSHARVGTYMFLQQNTTPWVPRLMSRKVNKRPHMAVSALIEDIQYSMFSIISGLRTFWEVAGHQFMELN